jgi:hypothetical protein
MPVTTPPALSAIPAFPALSERAAGTYNAAAYACLNHWATTGGPQLAALANNVAGNATDAAGSASSAATAKNDAESAATNAAGFVLLAYNWAVKTDGPVSGGEYSARYWAQQAAAVVATIPSGTINDGTTSGTSVWSSSKVSTELEGRLAKTGDTLTGALNWAAPATLASADTLNIGAAASNAITITGTTTITALGTVAAGAERTLTFSGVLTLTHNATSLILPGAANITTAAGDVAAFVSLGSGNWRCVVYQRASGAAVVAPSSIANLTRSARTSNTILGTADKGTLIDITSGTFTQTFTAAATLASGWWCYIRNAGTGDITLDPNASETIDGLTSYVMYPGEVRLVQCDGSAFFSVVLSAFNKEFSASGTFTKPPGYQLFDGFAWGAGGGGSKYAANGAGGGGGACAPFTLRASVVPPSVSVTIGAGGTGKSGADGNGLTGGNTTFGSLLTAYGGSGGESGQGGSGGGVLSAASGGTPGQPYTSGSLRENPGFGGAAPNGYDSAYGGAAGSSSAGGRAYAGGGGGGGYTGAAGGLSVLGGSGGAGSSSGTAVAGTAPAGGGGGTSTGTGGNGARGELRIWGVI